MKKENIKQLIIFIIIFGIIWTGNLYIDIKSASKVEIVKIHLDTDDTSFNNIHAYRISPSNFVSPLIKDNEYRAFYSENKTYLKQIKLVMPNTLINKINGIKVVIKKNVFSFTNEELLKNWSNSNSENNIILISPDYVRSSKSLFPYLKLIINWPGDFFAFIISFIITLFFCLIIFLVIIFFKNYILNNYKFCYWAIFCGIIFFALIQRMILNSLPYSGGDGWGYIGPAVTWFDSGKFTHHIGRSFPYPLFLLGILYFFNDFSYISIIQHFIGLFTGIILLFIWRDIALKISIYKKYQIYFDLTGLLLMALFLFSPSPIVLEHHLRPESIYPFFLILQIFFIYKFLLYIKNKSRLTWLFGSLFFINNYFLYIFQPRWGLTLFFNITVLIICFFVIKEKLIKKIIFIFIIPVILSFVLVYMPENILIQSQSAQESYLYGTLFWAHSKIIDIELEEDINDTSFNRYDKEMLKEIRNFMNIAFKQPKSKHKYLGFYFNRLFHDKPNGYLKSKLSNSEYKKFCIYYFKKAVINHPLKYADKVFLELSQFYNLNGNMYSNRDYKVDREIYNDGYEQLHNNKADYLPYRSYLNALNYYRFSYYDFDEFKFPYFDLFYFILSRTYIFVFIIFIILFIIQSIKYLKDKNYSFEFIFGIFIFILFMYNFFITLTSAMIYCLDVSRYIDDQFIIVIFSNILALIYIVLYIQKKDFFISKGKL